MGIWYLGGVGVRVVWIGVGGDDGGCGVVYCYCYFWVDVVIE